MNKICESFKDFKLGKSPKFIIAFILFGGVILMFMPLMLTKWSWLNLDYGNTGEIGDIIGGTTAPFISFGGIILTFYAFWVQYQANLLQEKGVQVARFESQFYEMLRLHKENVNEMHIENLITGRDCFVDMFYEFRYIYLFTFNINRMAGHTFSKTYPKEMICDLSYKIFLHGIKPLSINYITRVIPLEDMQLVEKAISGLALQQKEWAKGKKYDTTDEIRQYTIHFESNYYPFTGHSNKLGHYFRHLFQMVSLVANSTVLGTRDEKCGYLKLLRAQLSNYEQLMLYYNSLSTVGKKWIDNEYFSDYKMIKNIPVHEAHFGIRPLHKFELKNKYNEGIFEGV